MRRFQTVIVLTFVLFACDHKRAELINKDGLMLSNFDVYNYEYFDSRILRITSDYLEVVNSQSKDSLKVCRLFIEQSDINITYKINAVHYYSTILEDMPQGYLRYEDKLILVYTGLEKLFKKPAIMPPLLAKELDGKLTNNLLPDLRTIDPGFVPGLFSLPTWEIQMTNDSIVVNKNTTAVQRVKTSILELPDSIK